MKKLVFLAAAVICIYNTVTAQTNFTISGTVPTGVNGNIQLILDPTFLGKTPQVIAAPISNGHFELKANLTRNSFVQINHPSLRLPMYAEPGFDMVLNIPEGATSLSNTLTGKGAAENNFIQTFYAQFGTDFNDSLNEAQMLITSVDAYEAQLFAKKKAQTELFKSSTGQFTESFKKFMDDEIYYHYWRELFAYPIVNANRDQKILTVVPLPEVMLGSFNASRINNDAALISTSYRDFVKYYIIYSASKANGFNKFTDGGSSADKKSTVAKEKLSGTVYVYWLSRYIIDECGKIGGLMAKKLLGNLKEADEAKTSYQIAEANCNPKNSADQTASLQGGAAPQSNDADAGLLDINMKPTSLSKLKGKVVYIDFWASWCGPCRGMMPFSKQLHEQLTEKQKKQITFLYISIDQDTAAWRKGMHDLGIEGTQMISPGNWNSKACRYFQINSIPRYMIMNKQGVIVEMNAKRPSEQQEILNQLIKLAEE
jgi:thiol-disulfide isomerase/thioredoxin